jgi:hypothetical protein
MAIAELFLAEGECDAGTGSILTADGGFTINGGRTG